jgi:parvulin-like peptidyl-prolyl isomerase
MRKHVVSTALMACLGGFGCQLFTAGEKVSEPDPAAARAARTAQESAAAEKKADHGRESAHGQAHVNPHGEARANPHGEARANPHGEARANPHGGGHGHDEHANAKQAGDPAAGEAPAEKATAAHVLIRYAGAMRTGPEVTRSKAEAQKLAQEVAKKASLPGADFAALADQYTEDPSGKGRGGQLGTFGRGRMVPPFDKATFELAPGQTSGVVETAFGFHVIHREK